MATKIQFNVGDRVEYMKVPGATKEHVGKHATITDITGTSIYIKFEGGPNRWNTTAAKLVLLPTSEDDKLSALVNKRITPEQFERMI